MAMFPPEEQDVVRIRLAESLHAVISQRLLPRADGKGRAVAAEVMIVTPAIEDLILDGQRIGEIRDFIAEGREQYGMQTFDQHLADLVQSGEVTFDVGDGRGDATRRTSSSRCGCSAGSRRRRRARRPRIEPVPATAAAPAAGEMEGITNGGFDFYQQ